LKTLYELEYECLSVLMVVCSGSYRSLEWINISLASKEIGFITIATIEETTFILAGIVVESKYD